MIWIARTTAGTPQEVHIGPSLPASTAAAWDRAGLTYGPATAAEWVDPPAPSDQPTLFGGA